MRKIILAISIIFIFIIPTEARKLKGQILLNDDTLNVVMKIPLKFAIIRWKPDYESIQYFGIKYFDSNGKKNKLRPADAQEIRFIFKNEEIRMLNRRNTPELGNIFSSNSDIFFKTRD